LFSYLSKPLFFFNCFFSFDWKARDWCIRPGTKNDSFCFEVIGGNDDRERKKKGLVQTKRKKMLDEGIINNSRDNKRWELCKGERER
jgi:hypothetical protein